MRERGAQRESPQQAETLDQTAVEGTRADRYVGGQIPPVHVADAGAHGQSASELAYEEDENVTELKTKVGSMVSSKFGGDYKKAFESYDADHDGAIDKAELVALLKDAGVGNGLTRSTWATKIIEKLDKSADAKIEWQEFESVFKAVG